MQTGIFFLLSSVKLKHYSNTLNWYVIINKYYYMHLFSQAYADKLQKMNRLNYIQYCTGTVDRPILFI